VAFVAIKIAKFHKTVKDVGIKKTHHSVSFTPQLCGGSPDDMPAQIIVHTEMVQVAAVQYCRLLI